MRLTQIEAWALKVADDITQGHPVEDARVEVKSKWPEPNGAARRIAGHANAAYGEPILWIIGIDETKREVVGADKNDLASWYPQVQAEFSELAPNVIDLNVPYGEKTMVALLFDTERAPFVVKKPCVWQTRRGASVRRSSLARRYEDPHCHSIRFNSHADTA